MRALQNMYTNGMKMRSIARSLTAAAILSVAAVACGELTGPVSPSTPTDVVATLASATSVNVTWTPSPLNDGVISYSIYRNGAKVGESTTNSFTDTGLAQQITYVYSVAANCIGGIISDRSVETAASTVTTADVTSPTVVSNQPPTNSTVVSPEATVTVTFSEPMDPTTITNANFFVRITGGAAIAGTVTFNEATRTAVFDPTASLPNPVQFTATVTTGVKDLAGNALAAAHSWNFTTRDDTPPGISSTSPANGATRVSPNSLITITFNEAMDAGSIVAANIVVRTAAGTAVPGTVSYNPANRVATFTPTPQPLAQNTSYTVTVSGAVRDLRGNQLGTPYSFSFTTGDITPPTVTAFSPITGATDAPTTTTVRVTFNEPMDSATITATTVNLRNTATGVLVGATVVYDRATTSAVLTPVAPLAPNTNYTITVRVEATDVAGNRLATPVTSSFTTLPAPDTTAPTVSTVTPGNGTPGVATNTTVRVTFSEPMNPASLTPTTISLRNSATSVVVPATVTYEPASNTAVLMPNGPLANATNYTLIVTIGVRDAANNPMAGQVVSSFTTAAAPDNTPPTITSRVPINGATAVAVNSNVTVTFSEPMNPTTINGTNITLRTTIGSVSVPATVTYDPVSNTATLDPTADLANNTSYTVTVTTGVEDVAGNDLAATPPTTFTTVLDTIAPTVASRTPTAATGVARTTTVSVTFSEAMDPATITGTTFTVTPSGGGSPVAGAIAANAAGTTFTFTPSAQLAASTGYTVTVTTGAKDLAGNPLTVNSSFSFTTAP